MTAIRPSGSADDSQELLKTVRSVFCTAAHLHMSLLPLPGIPICGQETCLCVRVCNKKNDFNVSNSWKVELTFCLLERSRRRSGNL